MLTISLLGSATTCCLFGTSATLQQAICIRLLQGVFAGAVGVARGCVPFVTDSSNEGRAYAILGFVANALAFEVVLMMTRCLGLHGDLAVLPVRLSVVHVRRRFVAEHEGHTFTFILVERPATKWPQIFAGWPLFVNYPYLLPCAVAALITLLGD